MAEELEDYKFSFLLRRIAPLVMAPPGPLPPTGTRLRGVVRAGRQRARVVFSADERMESGVGFEFALSGDGPEFEIDAAIDWLRVTVGAGLELPIGPTGAVVDGHHNTIWNAAEHGFRSTAQDLWYDHNLFSLLSTFVHGGGSPWFDNDYTCAGFMLGPASTCRIYLRITATAEVFGVHLPLARADGTIIAGMAGSLPQELASLVDSKTLFVQPKIETVDDYCQAVYDLRSWVDPTAA